MFARLQSTLSLRESGGQTRNKKYSSKRSREPSIFFASSNDLYLLGITIVIGGQIFSWNVGLVGGFWETFFAFFFIGFGYLCLVLCLSEMTSALPFSGGVYGFIRATTGPYYGFLVGCCESMQNICYVSATAIPLAKMIVYAIGTTKDYEPLFWVLFYISSLAINIVGGKFFWRFNFLIGFLSLLLIVVYVYGSLPHADFNTFILRADVVQDHTFNVEEMLQYLPLAAWFFIGVESLPLCGRDCTEPKHDIPKAMMFCLFTLFITGLGILILTCSQSPGVDGMSTILLPLNEGYQIIFHTSDRIVTWLAIPGIYATGFGFMFSYGRQMAAMSRSGLLPRIFKYSTKTSETPYSSLIIGAAISFLIVLISTYWIPSLQDDLFFVCCLASYLVYINAFLGYIVFSTKYTTVVRHFVNPLGRVAAYCGIFIFSVAFISVVVFQHSNYIPITIFLVVMSLLSVYYFMWVSRTQQFSEEEQKALFTAYMINENVLEKKKKRKKRGIRKSLIPAAPFHGSVLNTISHPKVGPKNYAVYQHNSNRMEEDGGSGRNSGDEEIGLDSYGQSSGSGEDYEDGSDEESGDSFGHYSGFLHLMMPRRPSIFKTHPIPQGPSSSSSHTGTIARIILQPSLSNPKLITKHQDEIPPLTSHNLPDAGYTAEVELHASRESNTSEHTMHSILGRESVLYKPEYDPKRGLSIASLANQASEDDQSVLDTNSVKNWDGVSNRKEAHVMLHQREMSNNPLKMQSVDSADEKRNEQSKGPVTGSPSSNLKDKKAPHRASNSIQQAFQTSGRYLHSSIRRVLPMS